MPIFSITFQYVRIIRTLYSTNGTNVIEERQREKRIRDNRRVLLLLLSVLLAFIVLVIPNRIVWLISDHIEVDNVTPSTHNWLSSLGTIPYSFHAAVNPLLYSLIDPKFRQKVSGLLYDRSKRSVSVNLELQTHTSSAVNLNQH